MNRDMQASLNIIVNKATEIIKEKQVNAKANAKDKDIIALIVKDNMKAKSADTLSFEAMRDQVMTFLGAGHDPTATGVAGTLHLLSKHIDVQNRLREEIRQYMPFSFIEANREDPTYYTKSIPTYSHTSTTSATNPSATSRGAS
jgi:cytochrome P450